MKLEIGQKVFVKTVGNAARGGSKVTQDVVKAIGRKWFELESHSFTRFSLENYFNDGKGYSSNYKVYISEKEINDENEHEDLWDKARRRFDWGRTKMSLEMLRRINQILLEEESSQK